jgi:hypothetical protein
MTNDRTTTPRGLWNRTAQALGKLWAGVISLPDDRRQTAARWTDYTRFPPF